MDEPIFLIDEDLIALGKALQVLYPDTIHVSGQADAPSTAAKDPQLYRWCERHGAVLVTADFNMLRDQAILSELIQRVGLRVVGIRQIKGQRAQREIERIIGRWSHLRSRLDALFAPADTVEQRVARAAPRSGADPMIHGLAAERMGR